MKSLYRHPVLRRPLLVVLVLLLAALACTTPGAEPTIIATVSATARPTEIPATPVPPTPVPPTAVPAAAGRLVTFENVEFVVPTGLTLSEQGQIVAPVIDGTPWDVTVQHIQFRFTGYPLADSFTQPVIYVFPTAGFDNGASKIADLQDILALRPADANHLPFLPPANAAQIIRSQVEYLDFASGSGVRYLTQYGQGMWPINSKDIFYTFQGLTGDGRYYISVVVPISNGILPATGDGIDLEQLSSDFEGYLADVRTQLDAQPDESFTPRLAVLDALVQSITVK